MAAFNRDFRQSLHKASLLCLLAQGLRISDSCNDPVLQAKLLSLVPRELHSTPSDKLRKILKWFVARKSHLLVAVTAEEEEESVNRERTEEEGGSFRSGCVRTVEMLVSILRALSLRVRLVLALRPIPFKPSRERETFLSSPDRDLSQLEGGRQHVYDPTAPPSSQDPMAPPSSQDPTGPPSFQDPSLPLGEPSAPLTGAMFLKLMQQLKKDTSDGSVECSSSDTYGSLRETEDAEGSSSTARVRGRRKRGVVGSSGGSRGEGGGGPVKKRKVSSEASDPHDKCSPADSSEGNSSKTRAKGKRKGTVERKTPTTVSDTSPYFSKGRTDRGGESMEDDSDTDFLPSRKKTLKRVLFESSGSGEDGAPGDGACGVKCDDGDGGKGKVKRLNKGKMVKGRAQKSQKLNSEVREKKREESLPIGVYGKLYTHVVCVCVCVCVDETSSWAEVFMEDRKRYVCLHLPSSSVDLPKMCEKHYPHKFSYIISIENS